MSSDTEAEAEAEAEEPREEPKDQHDAPTPAEQEIPAEDLEAAEASLARSLITLGFVAFDGPGTDNTSSGVLVSEQLRRHFRRDAYVGGNDTEQGITFWPCQEHPPSAARRPRCSADSYGRSSMSSVDIWRTANPSSVVIRGSVRIA